MGGTQCSVRGRDKSFAYNLDGARVLCQMKQMLTWQDNFQKIVDFSFENLVWSAPLLGNHKLDVEFFKNKK
jgi:hypothetical protein